MVRLSTLLLVLAAAGATVYSFWIPPATDFQDPNLARIVCFHLPCAFLTAALLFLSSWFGFRYLRSREEAWNARATAATELGALYGALTMATGILFSRVQWLAWWQWDPRQTSFLFVLLLLLAGLALRAGLADEAKRAAAGAAYSLAILVPAIFLIFVYPRLPYVQQVSFHPSSTIQTGGFDRAYWTAILIAFAVAAWATVDLYRRRIRGLAHSLETQNAEMDAHRGDPARAPVVKPVPLRKDGE